MTIYQDLARAGTQAVQKYYDDKRACEEIAVALRTSFQRVLGAPSGRIRLHNLDDSLEFFAVSDRPELVRSEGRWYFGIQTKFEDASTLAKLLVSHKFGAQVVGDAIRLNFDNRDFVVSRTEPVFSELVDHLVVSVQKDITRGFETPTPRIGF